MKIITLLLALCTIGFTFAQAPLEEGNLQVNAGFGVGWGVPIYAGLELGCSSQYNCRRRIIISIL